LYALGLVAFTLYPMPDNPAVFCADYHLSPQLNPLQFIFDIGEDGLRAVLQVVMNIAFFVPLGVFLKNLFGCKLRYTLVVAFLVSLLIETAQLTGAFWIYPCSYRLFDIDDLAFNMFGALIGYLLATKLPDFSKTQKKTVVNTQPGVVHRFTTFLADLLLSELLTVLVLVSARFASGGDDGWFGLQQPLSLAFFALTQFVVPVASGGQTVMAKLTGISLDDRVRSPVRRLWFYLVRLAYVGAVTFFSGGFWIVWLAVTLVWYLASHKMPYAVADLVFRRRALPTAAPKRNNQPKS
jgi:glycopeptide antibiotics resistance protein